MIGIGMWLGIIMAFNVWVIIWPNQKKALGIVSVNADEKASAAKKAMLFFQEQTLYCQYQCFTVWLERRIFIDFFFLLQNREE